MDRRALLQTAGLVGLAALGGKALAAEHEHHHDHDHGAPAAGGYQKLVEVSGDCVQKGQACLAHCLILLGEGDKAMAACAQSVNQMLAVCSALQNLAGQNSAYTPKLARLAGDVCKACEDECRKHEKKHAECKACAESCAQCAKQCQALAA